MDYSVIGKKIRVVRKAVRLAQGDLAEKDIRRHLGEHLVSLSASRVYFYKSI